MAAEGEPDAAAEFAAALARFAPFDDRPALAVAVSGGADSTALAVLAADWVRQRDGALTALIVDHGLRPEAGEEARQTAGRMAALGIPSQVLAAAGAEATRPSKPSQAAARAFRYERLAGWCREHGVRHLLVGHHRRDQAETVLMRLLHGSGLDGLAGMAAAIELADVRILRPLLRVDPGSLRGLLNGRGIGWVEDPTNAGDAYERNRLRRLMPELANAGLPEAALLRFADDAARARAGCALRLNQLIAAVCRLSRFGHASIDPAGFAAIERHDAAALLVRVLAMVGGRPWPPPAEACLRLLARLGEGRLGPVGTLGGCVVARRPDAILIYRERRNLPAPITVDGATGDESAPRTGELRQWDGRFHLRWQITAALAGSPQLRALGGEGLRQWAEVSSLPSGSSVPDAVLESLPGLFVDGVLIAAPSTCDDVAAFGSRGGLEAAFRPRWGLSGHGYFLSSGDSIII